MNLNGEYHSSFFLGLGVLILAVLLTMLGCHLKLSGGSVEMHPAGHSDTNSGPQTP